MIFKNSKNYDRLKTIALVLPAIILLYGAIGKIWSIPYTEQVVTTLTAINTFVASIVKIASNNYNKTILIEQYYQEEENSTKIETDEKGEE